MQPDLELLHLHPIGAPADAREQIARAHRAWLYVKARWLAADDAKRFAMRWEAVRLAANEAALRGNVNAMFVNLSRRSQSLVERQIREAIEDGRFDQLPYQGSDSRWRMTRSPASGRWSTDC